MWSKRGTWTWADTLYWFFYIPMTALTVIALVTIPSRIMANIVQPAPMAAVSMDQRLVWKVADYSPVVGVRPGVASAEFSKRSRLSMPDARYAYKLSYTSDGKVEERFGNKDVYEEGSPLVPIRYDRFESKRKMVKDGKEGTLTVDQVFARNYARLS